MKGRGLFKPLTLKVSYNMELKVKDMDIATGDVQVVILNEKDAHELDLHHMDRIVLKRNSKKTVAILDIAESKKAVPPGHIGLFEEVLDALSAKDGDKVRIEMTPYDKTKGRIVYRYK